MSVERRLVELGVELPAPPRPGGAYAPVATAGGLAFVAAQFPIESGAVKFRGRLGAELTLEQGRAAARLAALNVLAQLRAELGSLDRVRGIVRVDALMLAAPGFDGLPAVLDAASALFNDVFPGRRHVRSLAGVASLPLDLPVELVAVAEVAPD